MNSIKGINYCTNVFFKANKMPKNQAQYINSELLNSKSVDIFCHTSTDEDGFNSAKIMHDYLKENGVTPRIICSGGYKNYQYNSGEYTIIQENEIKDNKIRAQKALCVDFSEETRIPNGVFSYYKSFDKKDIIGFDHHYTQNPLTEDCVLIQKSEDKIEIGEPKRLYIDSSAKSATAVITRFFQALGKSMTKNQKKSAYCGMIDDMNKFGYIKLGENQKIEKTEKFKCDKHTDEVFSYLEKDLDDSEKTEIFNQVDILANLDEDAKEFQKSLYNNIRITKNGRMAYVIIPIGDKNWEKLGGDNSITSRILRDFRIRTLEHKKADEFLEEASIEKLKNVEATMTFCPDIEGKRYKMSIHSNKDYAKRIIDFNRANYDKNLSAGGHANRSGGRIYSLDEDEVQNWINNFILSAENITY